MAFQSSNIKLEVLYPVPTEYMGDEQDNDEVGIATYVGPRYLRTRWSTDGSNLTSHGVWDWEDPSGFMPCPIDCTEVKLDAQQYPIHATVLWGPRYPGERMDVVCGPSSDPNPNICDPYYICEALEPSSCHYDVNTNSWSTPAFRSLIPGNNDWASVRYHRDNLLTESDNQMPPEDAPESLKAEWRAYRQKLRDMPSDWAGVGTSTYLVMYPFDPLVSRTRTPGVTEPHIQERDYNLPDPE